MATSEDDLLDAPPSQRAHTPPASSQGLASQGALRGGGESERWLANPALPADILQEAVPGNIRRAGG